MQVVQPDFIPQPFASEGVAATIPDTKEVFGQASWAEGFPDETGLPLNAGGIPPRRQDFNGTLKVLSQHTFFEQSGCLYPWSEDLDYLPNSHVVGSDGKEYAAKLASGPDTNAGAKDPVEDTDFEFWADVSAVIGTGGDTPTPASGGGIYNTREVLTTSGTYTAPVDGWYKVTCIGGGAGGGRGMQVGNSWSSGAGGASGGYAMAYFYLTKNQTVSYTIGAGGSGGTASARETSGGSTTFLTLLGGGGQIGTEGRYGGKGGTATNNGVISGFIGFAGVNGVQGSAAANGTNGAGFGGDSLSSGASFYGGGGCGGGLWIGGGVIDNGTNGYQGCVILEYYDPEKTA